MYTLFGSSLKKYDAYYNNTEYSIIFKNKLSIYLTEITATYIINYNYFNWLAKNIDVVGFNANDIKAEDVHDFFVNESDMSFFLSEEFHELLSNIPLFQNPILNINIKLIILKD